MAQLLPSWSIAPPAPDDHMEMSSPAHPHDEDTDLIDYESEGDVGQHSEDEPMQEDDSELRPATATDDMMEDDVDVDLNEEPPHELSGSNPLPEDGGEAYLQQETVNDDLIDYDDEDLYLNDTNVDLGDVALTNAADTLSAPPTVADEADADEAIERAPKDDAAEHTLVRFDPDNIEYVEYDAVDAQAELNGYSEGLDGLANDGELAHGAEGFNTSDAVPQQHSELEEYTEPISEGDQGEADLHDQQYSLPGALDTRIQTDVEGPPTPTDTGLHPMTIHCNSTSLPLFQSRVQRDGLLQDDNLANVSLADLLQSCKQRIVKATGIEIPRDQEMLLRFSQLKIGLVEGSRPSFEHSLNDILEVYLQLHRNAGNRDIPPLELDLSFRWNFTCALGVLKAAATDSKDIHSVLEIMGPHGRTVIDFDTYEEADLAELADSEGYGQEYAAQPYSGEQVFQDDAEQPYNEQGEEYHNGQYHEEEFAENHEAASHPQHGEYPFAEPEEVAAADRPSELAQLHGDESRLEDRAEDANDSNTDELQNAETADPSALPLGSGNDPAGAEVEEGDELIEYSDDEGEELANPQPTEVDNGTGEYDEGPTGDAAHLRTDIDQPHAGMYDLEEQIDWEEDSLMGDKAAPASKSNEDDGHDFLDDPIEDQALKNTMHTTDAAEHESEAPAQDQDHGEKAQKDGEPFPEDFLDKEPANPGQGTPTLFAKIDILAHHGEDELEHDEEDERFHTALDFAADDEDAEARAVETTHVTNGSIGNVADTTALLPEDDIGYSDDDEPSVPPPAITMPKSRSPSGKRNFSEHTELDDEIDFDFEEPEPKKARAG